MIKDIEHDVRTLSEAYKRAGEGTTKGNALFANFKEAKAAVQEEKEALFGLQTQQAQARLSVRKLKDEQSLYQKETQKVVESNESMSVSFKKALGVIGGVAALKQLGSEIIKVRGEFQAMQTAIETLVGKDMAGNLIPQIKELAKVSPLTLSDMVGAEKMMLGFNIKAEDTIRYLQALGDISMGNSQKFNSLTLAFSQMSATGKLMGQDLNQMINAGFNPLQTISEKTGKSIATLKEEMSKGAISTEMAQKAFIDATSEGGRFFGMSENASKTINGQLSMMQDALDEVFNEIGTKGEGAIMSGIQATTSLIHNYETIGKVLTGLIATFGVYKAATIAYYAITNTYGIYDIATKELQLAATMRNIVATKAMTIQQALLNKTMLANPYVLIATLVVGTVAAMWALHDSTTAAEKAQSKFNDELDKFKQKEEERKQKIETLIRTIQDETETEFAKVKAYQELQRLSPALTDAYKREELAVASLADTNKELNKVRDIESYDNIIANIDKYSRYVKELQSISGGWSSSTKSTSHLQMEYPNTNVSNARELAIEDLKKWQEALDEYKRLKKEAEENEKPVKVKLLEAQDNREQILQEFLSAKMTLEEEQRKIQESGFAVIPIDVQIRFDNAKAQLSNIDKIIAALMQGNTTQTYKEAYSTAEREWKKAQKALVESKKKSKAEYIAAKKDLDEKEKNFKDLGGVTNTTKQENQADKLREEQEKYTILLDKQKLDRQRQTEDLESQLAQSKIDGFDKEQAQRDLNNKKEIQALERQKDDYIRAVIQAEKDKFDAKEELNAKQKKGYVKQTFDSSTVSVDTSNQDKIIDNTKTKQGVDEWQQREVAMNEHLLKYGTFIQKKEAIDKKYLEAIEAESSLGGKNSLQKEWEEATANLNLDKLKKEINWEVVFGDMSKVAKKQLQEVKKQLQEFKKSPEFKNATPEQIKVIEEALDNINSALVDKGGFFGGLGDSLEDYKTKLEEAKKAQEEYDKALKTGNQALIEKATENRNAANANVTNSGTNVEKSGDKAVKNINAVSNAIVQLGKKDVSLTDIGNTIGALVDTLGKSGSMVGGIISAILSIIDAAGDVGTFQYGIDIIENVSSKVTDSFAKDTETMTGGLIDMSFMKSADYDDYNELVEEYDGLMDVWDQLLDKKKAYIKESYGAEATKVGQEALDLLNSEKQITKELANSRLGSGASAGSHSINYRMWKGSYDYDGTNWKDVAGDISKSLDGVKFDGMSDMLDMSSEQLEWIKTNYSGLWAHMDGDFKGYLDNIIEYSEVEKEIIASVKEQITGISFESFQDSYVNMLSDMDSTNEDFADNFEEYLKKSILQSLIAKNYTSKIQSLYDSWSTAGDDDVYTDDEINELRNKQQQITDEMLAEREELMKTMGWDSSSGSSQDSTQKGFASMSQDTGNELNGRFTALQISNEEIKNTMLLVLGNLSALSATSVDNNGILSDMRNLAVMSNSYLEDIARHTKVLLLFGEKLDKIESNTKGLSSR